MSKEAVTKVIQRAISDGGFRRQLSSDPTSALKGFDLSAAETAAIRSGDPGRLSAFGVDLRMSKAFTLSADSTTGASGDAVSRVVSSDLGASNTGALTGAASAAGNAAFNSGVNSAGNASVDSGMNSAGNASLDSGVASAGNATVDSGLASAGNATLDSGLASAGNASLISGTNAMGDAALISGDTSDTDPMIASGNELGREGVVIDGGAAHAFGALTGSDGGTALPDETDEYTPQFHSSTDNVIVSDDGATGGSMPGEASEGPSIQQ
jgi:hypothetical protein